MNRRIVGLRAVTLAATCLLVAGCGSAAESTRTEGEASSKVVGGESSPDTSASPAAETAEGAVLKVVESGFTQFPKSESSEPTVSYAVIVSNTGSEIASAQLQISLEDGSGNVVDTAEAYLSAVLPGTSVATADNIYEAAGVKKVKVQLLPGESEALKDKPANFAVSKVATKTSEYGGVKTTASVSSPFTKDLKDVNAVAVYRDAKGKILGGDFTFVNFIPAKGKASVSIDSMTFDKKPAKTEVYVSLSGLTLLE